MDGPDHKGLIYHVTRILFAYNQNIISNDEYVSPSRYFFMRTEFEGNTDIPERSFRRVDDADRGAVADTSGDFLRQSSTDATGENGHWSRRAGPERPSECSARFPGIDG